jgi:hypothetical protein
LENQGKVLHHLPDLWYYNVDFLSSKEREELIAWHAENYDQQFDNDHELKQYCVDDVMVLRSACTKFKNLVKEATTLEGAKYPGINVFSDSTIAGSAMSTFRQLILTEYHKVTLLDKSIIDAKFKAGVWTKMSDGGTLNPDEILKTEFEWSTIAQPPARGYNNSQMPHSLKRTMWLEYVSWKRGVKIQHCRRGGEKKILSYYVDGYDEVSGDYIHIHDLSVHCAIGLFYFTQFINTV